MSAYDDFVKAAVGKPPLRAPYAFVPLTEKVLPTPNTHISQASPHPEAISGTLNITFANETPLLVGALKGDNNAPFIMGDMVQIPGASLRGMTRAVVEIASSGRLNFVDDYVGAVRHTKHPGWKAKLKVSQNSQMNCGWLFAVTPKSGEPSYHLVPAQQSMRVKLDDICTHLGVGRDEWHETRYDKRLDALGDKQLRGLISAAAFGGPAAAKGQLFVGDHTSPSQRTGPKAKQCEYLAIWPESAAPITIDPKTAHYFIASVKAAKNRIDTLSELGSEHAVEQQMRAPADHAWPVFWRNPCVGNQGQTEPVATTILSLSAMMKVPYDNSLRDIAGRDLEDTDALDLSEGLFGWVAQDIDDSKPQHSRDTREKAYRGRVKFGFATANKGETKKRTLPGIAPRPSFYPYYLRPGEGAKHPVDYNSPEARLAGRKRYPARNGTSTPPQISDAQDQECDFLSQGHTFTARIRLHNLCPEELGALVWALTLGQFGQGDQGFRHMLGRGKPYGFGQIRLVITGATLTARGRSGGQSGVAEDIINDAISRFKTWVASGLEEDSFDDLPQIQTLLNTCHAATGAALRDADALEFPTGWDSGAKAHTILKGYANIREETIKRGGASAVSPPSQNRNINLPAYPRKPD